ncbi:MAG: RND transporter, partial [Gammaproteobacteria bacterium]
MDIPRPELKKRKRIRRTAFAVVGVLVVAAATLAVGRLEPAAPAVARASLWIDTVREGEMLRQVRGPGVLVPREIR